MGTDIHIYVEVCDTDAQEGGCQNWKSAQQWEIDEDGWLNTTDKPSFSLNRNYRLFAMLADVRNGTGFAGVDMGDALNPIDYPRDIPFDASPQVHQKYAAWGDDAHSASWFTVDELLEYDWTQSVVNRGVMSGVDYWKWSLYNKPYGDPPTNYSGDIFGPNIIKITQEEADIAIKKTVDGLLEKVKPGQIVSYDERVAAIEAAMKNTYVSVSWKEYYYQMASEFLSEFMPRLWRLGKPEHVRIVFWFDN